MGNAALDSRRAIDAASTQISLGIKAEQTLVGDQLLPVLPLKLSKVNFPKFGTEAFRMIDDAVSDKSEAKRIDVAWDKFSLEIDGHSLMAPVSYRELNEAQNGPFSVDLEAEALYVLKQRMLLRREKLQADLVQNNSLYSATHKQDLNGTSSRFDDASVDPTAVVRPFVEKILPRACGHKPNTIVMGSDVWIGLIENPYIKNRIFGTTGPQGLVTETQVAGLFGVEKLIVGRAVTYAEPATDILDTTSSTNLWGKNVILAWVPPTAGSKIPAFGYTPEQIVFAGGSELITRIEKPELGPTGGFMFKRSHMYTPALVFADAGAILYNAVS